MLTVFTVAATLIAAYLLGYYSAGLSSVFFSPEEVLRDQSPPLPTVSGKVCSHEVLREFYRQKDYFPGGGKWVADAGGSPNETFSPAACTFRWTDPPREYVLKRMKEQKISSIMMLGDSNSKHYYLEFVDFFSKLYGQSCDMIRREKIIGNGFVLDADYYVEDKDKDILERIRGLRRPCRSCWGQRNVCRSGTNATKDTLTLEHVPSMSVNFKLAQSETSADDSIASQTAAFLGFVISHYLPSKKPDVILLFPPFNHLKSANPAAVLTNLKGMSNTAATHIPASTRVYWMPAFSEFNSKKPAAFRGQKGLSMDQLNHLLFKAVKPAIVSESTHRYGFFDLVDMSKTREQWSLDGVHMYDEWYHVVGRLLVQLLLEGD